MQQGNFFLEELCLGQSYFGNNSLGEGLLEFKVARSVGPLTVSDEIFDVSGHPWLVCSMHGDFLEWEGVVNLCRQGVMELAYFVINRWGGGHFIPVMVRDP